MTVEQFLVAYDGTYNITVELHARNIKESLTKSINFLLANRQDCVISEWLCANVTFWTMDEKVLHLYVKK